MPRYLVQCYIEVCADFHREAAETALKKMRDPSRWRMAHPFATLRNGRNSYSFRVKFPV